MASSTNPPRLEVLPNRRAGLGMTTAGLAALATAIYPLVAGTLPAGRQYWLILPGLFGLLFLLTGLPLLLRRRPTLIADQTGISAAIIGSAATHIPWDLVTGIELVGRGKRRMLAILVSDVDKALERCPNSCRGIIKRYNASHNLPAGAYVVPQLIGRPIEPLADELRALAVHYLERAASKA
jgi:hypothetical protein